jgi:hypothetical protein
MEKDMHPKKRVEIYVIYDHPSDYPDHYVVRRHLVEEGGKMSVDPKLHMQSKVLEVLQHSLVFEMGLTRLDREPGDDPVIIESYI